MVSLDDDEARFVLQVLLTASGPGISLSVTQPLVAKIASQLPKPQPQSNNVRPMREPKR